MRGGGGDKVRGTERQSNNGLEYGGRMRLDWRRLSLPHLL